METALILKSSTFDRFAKKQRIHDAALLAAIREAEAGLYEADLGGGLIKKRISRPREGKSGGYRTIILFRRGRLAVFLHGFAKSRQANISASDLDLLKGAAREILAIPASKLAEYVKVGIFVEVKDETEEVCE